MDADGMPRLGRRICSLIVILALLTGLSGLPRRPCGSCPVTCPMHAKRLACHHGHAKTCHRAQGPSLMVGTCGHGEAGAAPTWQAVLPARPSARPIVVAEFVPARVILPVPRALADP